MTKHLTALLVTLLLFTGCSTQTVQVTPPPAPPVTQTDSPVVYFELDTVNHTIRPLGSNPDSATPIGKQTVYRAGNGFSFSERIVEQVGGVYSIEFTLTNTSQQDMGVDGEVMVTFVNFQAKNASNANVPGGGIVNPTGYQANTFFPYISILNDKRDDPDGATVPVKPGSSFKVRPAAQLPAGATRAIFGLMLRAAQEHNTVPIAPGSVVTPAFGRFNVRGGQQGSEEKTLFRLPRSITACPASRRGELYLTDVNGLWRLRGHKSQFLSSDPVYTGPIDLVCNESGLFISSQTQHRVYQVDGNFVPQVIAGTGTQASTDGPASSASIASPAHLSSSGDSLLVVEGTNPSKLRLITPDLNGVNMLSTRYQHTSGDDMQAAATDERGNIYFAADSGIWRLPFGSQTPVRIVTADLSGQGAQLLWHPSGFLVLSQVAGHVIQAFAPSATDPTLPWTLMPVAGTGAPNPPAAFAAGQEAPVAFPISITLNPYGTLFVASAQQIILRVDRFR